MDFYLACIMSGIVVFSLFAVRRQKKVSAFWIARAEEKARENRELREAVRNANADLRRFRAVLADLRTDPDGTLARVNAEHHRPHNQEGPADAAGR